MSDSEDPSSQTTNDTEPIDNESESPEEEQEIQCTGSTFKLEDDHGINSASTSAASSVSSTSLAKILNESAAQWASSSSQNPVARAPEPEPKPEEPQFEPLSSYTCPICFGPPMNATMTPCGHICCGSCLFAAVKSTLLRGGAIHAPAEANIPRCPVCRAKIPGWDGKGGGVIGLKVRTMLSL
ncbi:hypothetical protein BD779DRAFT_1442331 [Infundibulicybe gibba]|nr:hypothetical protein BD779DRAFT_1442331 [Infundibulicybe gibba]